MLRLDVGFFPLTVYERTLASRVDFNLTFGQPRKIRTDHLSRDIIERPDLAKVVIATALFI